MGKILTAKELAEYLQVKPETIRRWARENKIPVKKLSAKVLRFDVEAVLGVLGITSGQNR